MDNYIRSERRSKGKISPEMLLFLVSLMGGGGREALMLMKDTFSKANQYVWEEELLTIRYSAGW